MAISIKKAKIKRKHKRIRARISGTEMVPRLGVFRSANHIYCNLFDDEKNQVILSAKDFEIKKIKTVKKEDKVEGKPGEKTKDKPKRILGTKEVLAFEVGKLIAQKALEKKIKKVVFDRGGFTYHGRVKALADGAREGGLEF